ncbi:LacI family DNA-binding transcriptional regulator [Cellulomonas sp. GbtcB1]|uniref:LacI family DNA-binding transcriptional regulator n=1 Tax=Cellulomonas sp. GbtcB1 TaxID=2824746 RepID=UPI001C2FDBE6|nr:LacI family DNA-binding transcriptional regulator [Cellulomonas sp. GbtcB1]
MTGKVTLSDVARAAGVSLMTASRAVNGGADQRRRTPNQQRVVQVAERLGYVPDASAQAIARGRTSTLGLIITDTHDSQITTAVYDGVAAEASARGLSVSMMSAGGDRDQLVARVRDMHRLRVRGLVIAAVDGSDPGHVPGLRTAVDALTRSGCVVCTLGFELEGVSAVTLDEREGARSLTAVLVASGYRRPAILAGSPSNPVHDARSHGLIEGFEQHGLAVEADRVRCSGERRASAAAETAALLSRADERPDVIIVVSPSDVSEVLDATRGAGLAVPADVAVAVCGDTNTPTHGGALTRILTPWRDASEVAARYAAPEQVGVVTVQRMALPLRPVASVSKLDGAH